MLSEKFLRDLDFALMHGDPSFYQGEWRIVPSNESRGDCYDIYPDYAVDSAGKLLPSMDYTCIASGISGRNVALIQAAPALFRALDANVNMLDARYSKEVDGWRIEMALEALGRVMLVYPDRS